jgi:23S rRNA (adenine2503-C2)-methyltransferase
MDQSDAVAELKSASGDPGVGLDPASDASPLAAPRHDFFAFSQDELKAFLTQELSLPAFRASQLFDWVYKQELTDLSRMNNLSAVLRQQFGQMFLFPEAQIAERQISTDGTRKYLFELSSGSKVESVMIKQPKRMTLCVSSQVGCGMGCHFCRTASMGFRRNLSTSEILQQVRGVIKDAKNFSDSFQNIVFMGMGEPLHNYDNVLRALRILRDPRAFNFSGRKITISSVGLVPAIEKFGQSGVDVNLAVSLNATTNEIRSQIMPINKAFPIERLLETLRNFPLKPRRRITIEYVMLKGVNDSDQDLQRLPKLLRGIPSKVNLIPYNDNTGLGFYQPDRSVIQHWLDGLLRAGVDTTIRWSKGNDISAACGQLAVAELIKRKQAAEIGSSAPH